MKRWIVLGRSSSLAVAICVVGTNETGCSDAPTAGETTQSSRGTILGGDAVPDAALDSLGLLDVRNLAGGFCSGVLLNASWALTAQHCVQAAGADAPHPDAIRVQLASGGATYASDRIYAFGQHDVALVHLAAAIPVHGSLTFENAIGGVMPANLHRRPRHRNGRGASTPPP